MDIYHFTPQFMGSLIFFMTTAFLIGCLTFYFTFVTTQIIMIKFVCVSRVCKLLPSVCLSTLKLTIERLVSCQQHLQKQFLSNMKHPKMISRLSLCFFLKICAAGLLHQAISVFIEYFQYKVTTSTTVR